MKKQKKQPMKLILITSLIGMVSSLLFRKGSLVFPPIAYWVLGTIWFILFLVYGLVPVVANLLEEGKC